MTPTEINLQFTDAQVRELGCWVCRGLYGVINPCGLHHIRKLATSKKRKNAPRIGLCIRHHDAQGAYGEALHAGEMEFENNYGPVLGMLDEVNKLLMEKYKTN